MFRQLAFCCMAALLALSLMRTGSAQEKTEKVEKNAEIKFSQEKARAHMQELEERMFRLANLIREAQPEDSARLLLGVQKAREELIADHMSEASELLASLRLEQASSQQQQIIKQLEELKRLLLSANIDLELKLEQLRKLREAQQQLAKLIEKEQNQLTQTENQSKATELKPNELKPLEANEQRNQRAAGELEQFVKSFGAATAGACGSLAGAGSCMGNAAGKLGQSKPREATPEQQAALAKLQEASKNLSEAELALRKELEALVRQQVMEHLTAMIAQQRQVRGTTENLAPRVAERRETAVQAVRRLATSENEIVALCDKSLELTELTEFSVVLPVALRAVRERMLSVSENLAKGVANAEVIAVEQQIEDDLQALLDALKVASRKPSPGAPSQCAGCKGNLNKLLAEVKMLRWMQDTLHTKTEEVDEREVADTERQTLADPLSNRQSELREITRRLDKEFSGGGGE